MSITNANHEVLNNKDLMILIESYAKFCDNDMCFNCLVTEMLRRMQREWECDHRKDAVMLDEGIFCYTCGKKIEYN